MAPTSPASPSNYNDSLPPLRREALKEAAKSLPAGKWDIFTDREVGEGDVKRGILPFTADFNTSGGNKYTPTGFSVDEIRALGDFPDYATLSGVPLPSPYPEFNIDKAIPRPYRPYRWSYHQTMCRSSFFPTKFYF
jgi:hypothetical protein